jgi:serine/threonine protein kinase
VALTPGTRLGVYEVTAHLGEGGMGEVYRATDTNLKRRVALKVLPVSVAADADRLARFQREAEVLAALNHPNIAAIYGLERSGPTTALVMELVEGDDLSQRIARGAISLDEALSIAKQIADALEAAHDQGIIHRDLKPANIKVREDGTVKVLDFGLAKLVEAPGAGSSAVGLSQSPTMTSPAMMTGLGMLLGTAAYMSPEQARGKVVNKRADIWAFGCVLYEMLAGKRAFEGEDVSETLAAVLRADPDWDLAPRRCRNLLKRCLEKDPKRRLRDIGDAWPVLEAETHAPVSAHHVGIQRGAWFWIAAAALFAVIATLLAVVHFLEKPSTPERVRFQVSPPENSAFNGVFSLSPDGRRLAFITTDSQSRTLLWVHSLDSGESRSLGSASGSPFWSPDSRFIGFEANGKLKKVGASGGPVETVCDVPTGTWGSGAWNQTDEIVFGVLNGPLFRVLAAGGAPSPLTTLDRSRQEVAHSRPRFLPDGRHFLYLRSSSVPEVSGIYVASLDVAPQQQSAKRLIGTQYGPVFAASSDQRYGQLLFLRDGTVMAQLLDIRRLELAGEAVPVAEDVGNNNSFGSFSASTTAALAYRSSTAANSRLTWFDRRGNVLDPVANPGSAFELALSPDARRVATRITEGGNDDIWLLDFARGTRTRFTVDPGQEAAPIWSPDGSQIVFVSTRNGIEDLYRKSSSGGEEALLYKSNERKFPQDWSRDGRFLLYSSVGSGTDLDLWVLPLEGERKPVPFLKTLFSETQGRFSPDSRWIAYTSNESGKAEVYVRPFPASSGGGSQWMVSTAGGNQPRWRTDAKELFYVSPDNTLMSVEVSTAAGLGGQSFQASVPKALFNAPMMLFGAGIVPANTHRWDVTGNGQRFLINAALPNTNSVPITVVLNWQAALGARERR